MRKTLEDHVKEIEGDWRAEELRVRMLAVACAVVVGVGLPALIAILVAAER